MPKTEDINAKWDIPAAMSVQTPNVAQSCAELLVSWMSPQPHLGAAEASLV